jgi:hypothetical protein
MVYLGSYCKQKTKLLAWDCINQVKMSTPMISVSADFLQKNQTILLLYRWSHQATEHQRW